MRKDLRRPVFWAMTTVPVGLMFNLVQFAYDGDWSRLPLWYVVVENVFFLAGTAGLLRLRHEARSKRRSESAGVHEGR